MLQHSHQTIRKSGVELLSAQLSALLPDVGRTNTRSAASAYKIYGTAASTSPALPAAAVPHLVSLVSSLRPFLAPPAEGERGGSCAEHEAADLASVTIATPAQRWPLQQQQQMPTFAEASTAQAALLSIDVIAKGSSTRGPVSPVLCRLNLLCAAMPSYALPHSVTCAWSLFSPVLRSACRLRTRSLHGLRRPNSQRIACRGPQHRSTRR